MLDHNHYASLLEDQESPPVPCPVCTGDDEAPVCSEDCDRIVKRAQYLRGIKGLYCAARTALFMARVYRREGGKTDRRMVKALEAARIYRASIKACRETLAA